MSVAVGELADGLYIDLDMVTKKYDGLDGTELAISESQERMAVAVAEADVEEFMGYAAEENLEATVIAEVTCEPRVRMAWQGDAIVDLSRDFLNSNGAPKYQDVHVVAQGIAPIDPESELAEAALEEFGTLDGIYESTVPMVPGAETCDSFRRHGRARERPQRVFQQGPVRALRLHHRRRNRAHALRRRASAHPEPGHGRQVPGRRRDHHGLRHGLGLQSLHHGRRPVSRRLPLRRREHLPPRGHWLRP
ncbi:MAG: AIR synthase-related protein [Coriobacteriaceae bacterium]